MRSHAARARRRAKAPPPPLVALVVAALAALAAASTTAAAAAAADTATASGTPSTTTTRASCVPLTRCRPCGPGLAGREPEACAGRGAARRVRCTRAAVDGAAGSAAPPTTLELELPLSMLSAGGGEATVWASCVPSEGAEATEGEEEEEGLEAGEDEQADEEEETTTKSGGKKSKKRRRRRRASSSRPRDKSVLVFELGVGLALGAAWPVMAWRKRRLRQGYLPL